MTTKTPRALPLLIVAALLVSGAQAGDAVLKRGAETLQPFKKALVGALQEGMQQGPTQAIEACQLRAPEIAASISVEGVEVGRTSHRLRNTGNVGPDWTAAVLELYLHDA